MTDQITRHMATKLTRNQKRGFVAGKLSTREMNNDRRVADPVKPRDAADLYAAQRHLAGLAMERPAPEREAWLRDVLEAMGLRSVRLERFDADERQPCHPFAGTVRGYNQHLRTYTRPCASCDAVRLREQSTAVAALGITDGGEIKWS